MNILDIEKKCMGCGACTGVCPTSALSLSRNEDGFYRPALDRVQCVDCGKCIRVCPVINAPAFQMKQKFYYGWCNEEKIRAASSSGGVFSALAETVLASGGIVFGAAYSEDFRRVAMASTEETTPEQLRVSKYCSADTSGLYQKMAAELKKDRKVLLTGTPCQAAAARRIFGSENKNLVLVDFLCGGNPSAGCYEDYICSLEKKYRSRVVAVNFRDKRKGWSRMTLSVRFENGREYCTAWEYDPYYFGFCRSYTRDEQCLDCAFSANHESDITIADFWGFRNAQVHNDEKGMSLIAVHSQQGEMLFDEAKREMTVFELDRKLGGYGFVQKHADPEKAQIREAFFEEFRNSGFTAAAKKTFYKGGKAAVTAEKIRQKILGR